MKKPFGIITALLILIMCAGPASALSLVFADSTLTGEHEMLVIADNGTLLWQGNTTSTCNLSDFEDWENQTFILHLTPEAKNILETPETLLDEIGYQVRANLIVLLFIGIMAIVLFGRK